MKLAVTITAVPLLLLAAMTAPLARAQDGHNHHAPATAVALPATKIPQFSGDDEEEVRTLIFDDLPALGTPRQLTRFLCGLSSPATVRAKLTKRPEFGRYSTVPFRLVMALVEKCWAEIE